MDELSQGADIREIRATVQVPASFEVASVILNGNNVAPSTAEVECDTSADGTKLRIYTSDGSALTYVNRDASSTLATISIKLKQELTKPMSEEIKVQSAEVIHSDNTTQLYDASGASAQIVYVPPAEAVGKTPPNGNPLVAHKFGADPYALVYNGRVYIYATNDVLQYDDAGKVKDNTYSDINKISVISSDDLVNWTDHGAIVVARHEGAAKWATQSWAPAAAHKVIDGKDKFFLYFANNASGIGVLTSDSPTGPWVDPIGKPLIARSDSGAQGVTWLFDPAVLVDDDGKAYIYYGGGIQEGQEAMPNTARVMQLGDDMTSVVGEAQVIPAPFMFEDAGINKVGDTYYYSYCSNFYNGERPEGSPPAGEIAYMTSSSPMGPWTYQGTILKNPGYFFGVGGNNHHAMFQFNNSWYIAYHAQTLSKAMGVAQGYRSTHLNKVTFNTDGSIQEIAADLKGVDAVKTLNPFDRTGAETIAWSAGINVVPAAGAEGANMAVGDIDNGDWTAVANVEFGQGASAFTAAVSSTTEGGAIEVRLDGPEGELAGTIEVPSTGADNQWVEVTTPIQGAAGIHSVYFVFRGKPEQKLFQFESWQFGR
ncbi:family 43 glycosylhydrolase [Paenibacillus cellulosilyticus]|nr:family 43 glycosylhydrolase [Paenibacillus cellulosilyticus]